MYKDETQPAFAVLSTFLMNMCSETFPKKCLVNNHELLTKSRVFGLYQILELSLEILPDTITWLTEEGYLRSKSVGESWYITLTEKGAKAIDFKFAKPSLIAKYDLSSTPDEIIAGGKDGHGEPTKKSLILKKPAINFIPDDWLD